MTDTNGNTGQTEDMATAETGGSTAFDRREVRRTSLVSLLGSTIEWYDFFIYGTAAALVLNTAFFPGADHEPE